jgi:hypothetical protein
MTVSTVCEHCGCEGTPDNEVIDGYCGNCEADTAWCEVCQERFSRDSEWCRHIFWTDCGDYGAGSYEYDWDECRESFFHMLDLLEAVSDTPWDWMHRRRSGLVGAVEAHIAADDFWTFQSGPLIGAYPDNITFRCKFPEDNPNYPAYRTLFADFHHQAIRVWEDYPDVSPDVTKVDAASIGWQWLESLDGDKTKRANARTVKWIMEWRLARQEVPLER